MKNLYVMITTLLFCNCITIDAIDSIQDGIQKTQHLTSPHQDSDLHEISSHYDTAIVYLSEKWQLTDLEPFVYPSVFNNYIARAYSHKYKRDVVLKISESNDECRALQYLQCDGMVNVLDFDHEYCALLLQYIPSQGTLADFLLEQDDDAVINAFVHLFKKIHSSEKGLIPTNFKTVQENMNSLHSYNFTKVPEDLLQKALQISDLLLESNEPQYLLHGDLHFRNILQHNDGFIAIDPWSAVGPLEYEAASFLTSPTDLLLLRDDIKDVLQNRLNRLSDLLNFNKKRLKDCAFLRILFLACLCETKDKNDDWIDQFIQVAQVIDQLNENE